MRICRSPGEAPDLLRLDFHRDADVDQRRVGDVDGDTRASWMKLLHPGVSRRLSLVCSTAVGEGGGEADLAGDPSASKSVTVFPPPLSQRFTAAGVEQHRAK
jgi:hypothetical protein